MFIFTEMRLFLLVFLYHTVAGQDCSFPATLHGSWTTTNLGAVNITGATPTGQDCSFPAGLHGSWTTTNLGAVNITGATPSMTTALTLTGAAGTLDFNCAHISGSQYVLQSTSTISVFDGTLNVYAYMCMDLRQVTANSYYYYMNSDTELGFGGMRMVGLVSSTVTVAEVCATTLPVEEFHTMLKVGNENDAIDAVRCPDNLLGQFYYTYTDVTGTFCSSVNTSLINTCTTQNLTTVQVNNTGCTERMPFYSSGGLLGCLFSLYKSSTRIYYTMLYNLDSSISERVTYRFTCVATAVNTSSSANGTVLLSMLHTDCAAGQDTTTLQSEGALMVLAPDCVPSSTEDTTSYIWLIPVLVCIAVVILLVVVGVCLYLRHRRFLKKKSREKKTLIGEEHPLGEVSISLDAPASLDRGVVIPLEESIRSDTFARRTPRSGRKGGMSNPLSESSLHLDFKGRSWSTSFYSGKGPKSSQPMDPFTEMDSGMVVPLSQRGSKTAKSLINQRQKSFIKQGKAKSVINGDVRRQPLPITDGREVYPDFENPDLVETLAAKSVKSMKTVYDPNDKFPNKAPSIAARSDKPRSIKVPNMKAQSVKAPSMKAPSIKAPTENPIVLKCPSENAASVKAHTLASKSKLKTPRSKTTLSIKAPTVKSAGARLKASRLTRSLTTTKIGSITKRLTSPRKKVLKRSSTVVVPKKIPTDEPDAKMADFLAGEMTATKTPPETARSVRSVQQKVAVPNGEVAVIKSPSETVMSRRSVKSGVGTNPGNTMSPRKKKTQCAVERLPAQMTDEEKIEEIMRVNSQLAKGTINPEEVRRVSFFDSVRHLSNSVLKPKGSKKPPWKG